VRSFNPTVLLCTVSLAAVLSAQLSRAADPEKPVSSGGTTTSKVMIVNGEAAFSWSAVDREQANVLINNDNSARHLRLELISAVPKQAHPVDVRPLPPEFDLPAHGSALVSFQVSPEAAALPRRPYDAVLEVIDEKGAVLTSARIKIAPDAMTPAASSLSMLTMQSLNSAWSVDLNVPLKNDRMPTELPKVGDAIGYLQSTQGKILPIRFRSVETDGAVLVARLCVDPMSWGHFVGNLYFDGQKAIASPFQITIDGQDNVIFAIIDIVLAMGVAALLKTYLSTWRVFWLIKRQAAGITALIEETRKKFEKTAPGSHYDPTVDLNQQLTDLLAAIDAFGGWQRQIADNRTWFNDRLQDIKTIESQLNDWLNLALVLSKLKKELDDARAEIKDPRDQLPLWMIDVQLTYDGATISGAALGKANQDAQTWNDFGRSWIAVYRYWQQVDLSFNEQNRYSSNMQDILRDLFASETLDALGALKGRVYAVGQRVQSDQPVAVSGLLGETRAVQEVAAPPLVFMPRSVSIQSRQWHLRLLVRYGDVASFIFGVALATLSSLGTYYFGKSFGSAADYLGLFVAAAGVKAGVDWLASFADRFAGVAATRAV
jgi:hypothetical protein